VVKKHADGSFGFALAARDPVSSRFEDVVAAGQITRGAVAHRGTGKLALDLANLKAAAPGYTGDGYLLAGFFSGPIAKAAEYRLVGFAPPGDAPVTALFAGFKTDAGLARVRVAAYEDVVAGATTPSDKELVIMHGGWLAGVGGRAHTVVTDWKDAGGTLHGDVPVGDYYLGFSCWAPGAATGDAPVLEYQAWWLCTAGMTGTMGGQTVTGPMACRLSAPVAEAPAGATIADCPAAAVEPPEPPMPADPATGDPANQSPGWTDEPNPPPPAPADLTDPALATTVP
jgi:hypothetical protein